MKDDRDEQQGVGGLVGTLIALSILIRPERAVVAPLAGAIVPDSNAWLRMAPARGATTALSDHLKLDGLLILLFGGLPTYVVCFAHY